MDEREVIEYLNSHRFTVLWSGGKDSTAALLWILDRIKHEKWKILYIEVTGNTHPLCNQYVHQIAEELGLKSKLIHARREDLDFFECLRRWGIPVFGRHRWCMFQFKARLIEQYASLVQVAGIRKEDSIRRRKNTQLFVVYRQTGNKVYSHSIVINPIYNWTGRQVVEYLRKHDVPLNPCYHKYGHSGNCMFCPYHTKSKIIRTLREPEWREKILSALEVAVSRKGKRVGSQRARIYNMWMKLSRQTTLEQKIKIESYATTS